MLAVGRNYSGPGDAGFAASRPVAPSLSPLCQEQASLGRKEGGVLGV